MVMLHTTAASLKNVLNVFCGENLDSPCFSAPTLTVYVCPLLSDDHYDISLSGRLTRSPHLSLPQLRLHSANFLSLHSCRFLHLFTPTSLSSHTQLTPLFWPVIVLLLSVNKVFRQCAPPNYNTAYLF